MVVIRIELAGHLTAGRICIQIQEQLQFGILQ
jgi:hypothetical protein